MIRRPYTDFLTRPSACLPACLSAYPTYLYLPVPIMPTYLYLPVCICNLGERSAQSKALLDSIAINCINLNRSPWAFVSYTFKR